MNIIQGHKHFPTDIIGYKPSGSGGSGGSGGGIFYSLKNNGGLLEDAGGIYIDFPAASLLRGSLYIAARQDHRHDNIVSVSASGNIYVSNSNGVYNIELAAQVAHTFFTRTNTYNIQDSNIVFEAGGDPTRSAKFNFSTLSQDLQRTYTFPDTSGVVVVSTVAADGTITSIGTIKPPIPEITLGLCESANNGQYSTVTVAVDFDGVTCPLNLSGFNITYRASGAAIWENVFIEYLQSDPLNLFPAELDVINLIPGQSYTFKVEAVDLLRETSGFSDEVVIVAAGDIIAPDIPTNLLAQYLGDGYISLQWSMNDESDFKEYKLYKSTSLPVVVNDINLFYTGSINNFTGKIVDPQPIYYFKLIAKDYSGNSSDPQETSINLPEFPTAPVVSGIELSTGHNAGGSYIDLSFTDTSINHGRFSYIYKYIRVGYPDSEKVAVGNTSSNYRFANIISNVEYEISVASITNLNIQSEWVLVGTIVSDIDDIKPAVPTGLECLPLYGSVSIKWNKNADLDLLRYELYISTMNGFVPGVEYLVYSGIGNSALIELGRGQSTWYVKLAAFDTSENRSIDYISSQFEFDIAPSVPVNNGDTITSTALTAAAYIDNTGTLVSSIKISFNDVARDSFSFYEYKIYKASSPEQQVLYSSQSSYYDFIVLPNVDYNINVRIVDNKGNRSNWATTPDLSLTSLANNTAPDAPTNLSATGNFGAIHLSWQNPSNKDIKHIKVFRDTTNDNSDLVTPIGIVNSNTYIDALNVELGTIYYYWLKATNTSGIDSIFSLAVTASSIQVMPSDLDISARADFIVKDIIFRFQHVNSPATASTTLDWFSNTSGGIIYDSVLYSIASTGSISNADSSYIIATLNGGNNTVSLSAVDFGTSLPTLQSNQIIIALTSKDPLTETNNYACYVRQANSMSIEGAIIRDATISNAKIQSLSADKIEANSLLSGTIMVGDHSLSDISTWAYNSQTVVEDWFQDTDPILSWPTSAYGDHNGDRWYSIGASGTGELNVFRYVNAGDYAWYAVSDPALELAFAAAQAAQYTADGKRRVFTAQPFGPYDVGDLWVAGTSTSGLIKSCTVAAVSGYNAAHWTDTVTAGAPNWSYVGNQIAEYVADWSDNPAGRINNRPSTVLIDPGKILISGASTLANWRNGTDSTKIEGGSIAANTITANKLTIGNRNITITGIDFKVNEPTINTIYWTAGTIKYIDDTGSEATCTINVNSSGILYTSGTLYVYWTKGTGTVSLSTTTSYATANGNNTVCLATYSGGTGLVANYGGTIIDGSKIVTGTIDAAKIKALTLTANELSAGAITADKILAGAITTDKLSAGAITSDKLAVGANIYINEIFDYGTLAGFTSGWTNHTPGCEFSLSLTGGYIGGKYISVGKNSGNDQALLSWNTNIPFDPNKLYKISVTLRKTAGSGTATVGWLGIAADGITPVNVDGVALYTNQHGHCINSIAAPSGWNTYSGYTKGSNTAGSTGPNTITNPGKMHSSVRYIRPMILVNASSQSGITDIDSFTVETYGTEIDGNSIVTGTIVANKLTLSSQEINTSGITFSTDGVDTISWTSGDIVSGTIVSIAIPSGSAYYTGQPKYIYWDGASIFKSTTSIYTARAENCKLLAIYTGGSNIDVLYGETIIEGNRIKTGTITANNIAAETITGTEIHADTISTVHLQAASITADKLVSNSITTDKLEVSNRTRVSDGFSETPVVNGYTIRKSGVTSITFAHLANEGIIGNHAVEFSVPST
jgi:hypothetical protein